MRIADLLPRLAIDRIADDARAPRVVLFVILLYLAGFLAFYPRVTTNEDETRYVHQAVLLAQGSTQMIKADPLTGQTVRYRASSYPVGTALLMTPLVWLGGWRAAFLMPCLCLLFAVWITARWLRDEGRSPLFALLLLAFPASLVLGRVPISDVPSTAAAALGLWLFWRGIDRGWRPWLLAGLVAGASITLRLPNVLPFAFFFLGAAVRRDRGVWALAVGGLLGIGVNLLAHGLHFGDPLYTRGSYVFAPETLGERLPLYLFGLLVLFPGGLVAGLVYRGRRRPELVATVVAFFLFYLLQAYGMTASSYAKRVVIALRYFCPLLPILCFAAAEVAPRAWAAALRRAGPARRSGLEAIAGLVVVAGLASVATSAVLVHWASDRWATTQAQIQEAIHERAGDGSVVVVNYWATRKHLRLLDRPFLPVKRHEVSPHEVEALVQRHGEIFLVFLDRSDSDRWRRDARENAAFLARLHPPPVEELDLRVTPTDRLRIWRIGGRAPP